jgi:hypothetical protein
MIYERPKYSVVVVTSNGTRYYLKGSGSANQTISLTINHAKDQLAQKAEIKLANFKIPGRRGGYPSSLFPVKSKVYIYAQGVGVSKSTEIFRGFIWENKYSNRNEKEVLLTCYDNLIYLMNSEICMYFSKGKMTKTVLDKVCKKWGIKMSYNYYSIKHPKLPLAGALADVLTGKVLKKVKDKKHKGYVIDCRKGVMHIDTEGKNKKIYIINKGGKGISIGYTMKTTMDGMVTKVLVAGKTNSAGKTKIETTHKKNTKKYGTLQRIVLKEEDMKLKEAKQEAKQMLTDHAQPKKTYEDVTALDIPWIRKGHKIGVYFSAKKITYCIVKSITHQVDKGIMKMDLEKAK